MKTRDWIFLAAIVALALAYVDIGARMSDLRKRLEAVSNPELPTRWEFGLYSPGRPERPVRRWHGYTSHVRDGAAVILVDETPTIGAAGEVK